MNVVRTPEEEKHFLKILVRSAILRQKIEGSTYLKDSTQQTSVT